MDQADQIGVIGHRRELTADGLRRQKESNIVHGGTSLMCGLRHAVGTAAKGALYRETLQATGRTTRVLNRHKRVCADSVTTNSDASAFNPQESALLSRAPQPTMASAIGYGKPELSTLLGIGTFYFALTRSSIIQDDSNKCVTIVLIISLGKACKRAIWMRAEPELDLLRPDARFEALLRRNPQQHCDVDRLYIRCDYLHCCWPLLS